MKLEFTLMAGAALLATTSTCECAPTFLPLKCGEGTCTPRLVSDTFGTNLSSLPFTGTNTYEFYSPPLLTAASITVNGKGGGVIFMRNRSTTSANDFSISGQMRYYDYDPASGNSALIVDTTPSPKKDVNHGQTVNWAIPNALLFSNTIVPVGHLVRVSVTLGLVTGNPGAFGDFLYNGPQNSSTVALFPQNAAIDWNFGSPLPAPSTSLVADASGSMVINFPGIPGLSYTIQATTNFANPVWVNIGSGQANTNGLLSFIDSDAKVYPVRFYRTSTP